MKKEIVIDFDGVLFHTGEVMLKWIEKYYGIEIHQREYTCGYSLHRLVSEHLPASSKQISEEELFKVVGEGFLSSMEHHEEILPVEGACEAIQELSQEHILHVATARLTLGRKVVRAMLDNFFPGCIKNVHHVWHIDDNGIFRDTSKKSFIETLDAPILFIDDSPGEISGVSGTVDTVLFDTKNHHTDVVGMTHKVSSWNQVVNLLDSKGVSVSSA